ncbi:hypothetical protein F0U44_09185 [Nocardioides humilatus]|uniref:PASTA domain-containing protein n=1 Tax=Nocardioides humilatus TaxID=2607660 RepID=A0A5B1LD45_9ACTN|nr:hypothetical protein [Nocardioides humilatus]KAA1418661.1 hypothetical protein F0U44_09185 [Nocardioides humilatus]
MTEPRVLPDVIERFLDTPVATPALAELRAAGAVAVRRRRRRMLSGTALAVALIVGGVAVGHQVLSSDGDRADDPVPPPADSTLEPPPGMRWAGTGRVVVAVPSGWKDLQAEPCRPAVPAVYFLSTEGRHCSLALPASSLLISDHPLAIPSDHEAVDGQVDGYDVVVDSELCAQPRVMTCSLDISVPDLGAYFRITIHGTEAEQQDLVAVRQSLTVLPDSQAAVPLVKSWHRSDVEDAVAAMQALGLEPTVEDGCHDAGLCDLAVWTDPPAGRVVAAGTPVTIFVVGWGDGPDPYPLDQLTCDNPYQRSSGTIDVIAPRSPKEAREQDWPSDPMAAVEGVPDAPLWRHLGIADLTLLDAWDDGLASVSAQDADGRTVLIMRVEELVEGAWAMTGTETC